MTIQLADKSIPIQRWKLDFMLLAALVFVGLGIWMLTTDKGSITKLSRFQNINFIHFMGFAAILIFAPAFYIGLGKRFKEHKELVLKWDGFHYQSLFVSWAEVTNLSLHEPVPPAQVRVDVLNPERYTEIGSEFQRKINRMNLASHGTPFFIPTILMTIDAEELLSEMEFYWHTYSAKWEDPKEADWFDEAQ